MAEGGHEPVHVGRGDPVEHLARALGEKPSPEARTRLKKLLRECEAVPPAVVRERRAVAALEWIGTPAARAVLRALADGASGARLTAEAKTALGRMAGR